MAMLLAIMSLQVRVRVQNIGRPQIRPQPSTGEDLPQDDFNGQC